eukprot:298555_1
MWYEHVERQITQYTLKLLLFHFDIMLQIRKPNKSGRQWFHSLKHNYHHNHLYLMHIDPMKKKKNDFKSQLLRWTKDSKIDKRSKQPIATIYEKCKRCLFLSCICICAILFICFLSQPSIQLSQPEMNQECKSYLSKQNNNIIINSICSLITYLNTNTFINRECYFKHPVEGHWAIGTIMTIFYSITKKQHCPTVNINKFLTDNTNENINDNNNKFTILINTWERNDCLIKSVEHYLKCNDVSQIRVIWSDPKNNIPKYLKNIQHKLSNNRLVFDEYKDNKLTNRFKYNNEWITNGIFQTDDDIKYSCELLSNTFKLWKLFPDYMIGFAPREPENEYKSKNKNNINMKKQFYKWDEAGTECKYSMMFVTLGGFMHKKYYKLYTENDINGWEEIKQYVNGNITAEDISMSLLYSYNSGLTPISVVVSEPNMFIDDFLYCQKDKSIIMHSNSKQKRTNIYMDILNLFGYFDNNFDLTTSTLWVDVMPLSDHKCWLG